MREGLCDCPYCPLKDPDSIVLILRTSAITV
jgi:hypothetical protein